MTTMEIICSITFPLVFVVISATPFLLEICDAWQTSFWEYEDDGYKYDKIHGRRKKMNKKERIEKLEEQVENLKRELEYVEHKNDKAELKAMYEYVGCMTYSVKYPNHIERKLAEINLGTYRVSVYPPFTNEVKIVKETDNDIYVLFQYAYSKVIRKIHKDNGKVTEIEEQELNMIKLCLIDEIPTKKCGRLRKNKEK